MGDWGSMDDLKRLQEELAEGLITEWEFWSKVCDLSAIWLNTHPRPEQGE